MEKPMVFVDVETTGLSARWGRVIEIGLLRVEGGEVVEQFSSVINPGVHVPSFIHRYTGITRKEIREAPRFEEVCDRVERLLGGGVMMAHNARFDWSFLVHEFGRMGRELEIVPVCTVKLFREMCPGLSSYGLDSLINYFDIECVNRHRALDDASVLWEFVRKAGRRYGEEWVRVKLEEMERKMSGGRMRYSIA